MINDYDKRNMIMIKLTYYVDDCDDINRFEGDETIGSLCTQVGGVFEPRSDNTVVAKMMPTDECAMMMVMMMIMQKQVFILSKFAFLIWPGF